jgi:succinate-semialdehyde dehydrogenase/glutarate-semialdehyde dehydrogenase
MLPVANKGLWRPASYINGQFVAAAAKEITVVNPATHAPLGTIPNHGAAETVDAIAAAKTAFASWRLTVPKERGEILARWAKLIRQHDNDLALIMTTESGKSLAEAKGENGYSASFIEWYAGEAERVYGDIVQQPRHGVRTLITKQPVGVVGIVTPWNFPSAMMTRGVAAALAAGCTTVVKPSELTPYSATALAFLAQEAGVPAGVINVVLGDAVPIGEALTASNTVRKLCFTGSTRVGKLLMAQSAQTVKKLSMELGGNAPFIVFEDADLDMAVNGLIGAKLRNAGQTCISANRAFVHESVAEEFVKRLTAKMAATVVVGDGCEPGVTVGPLITPAAAASIERKIAAAVEAGATKTQPNKTVTALAMERQAVNGGNFVLPTVLSNVTDDMAIAKEEIFGPVVAVLPFSTEAEVVERANSLDAGLAAYFFTENYRRQWRVSEALDFGMVGVNESALSSPSAPFGGMKQSGLGRDGSKYGIEGFLDIKYTLMGGKI